MLVLGIESTCDETACAVVRDGKEILSSVISSQIDLHQEFGGVVPELACRRHVEIILPLIQEALTIAKVTLEEIDVVAAAYGPGLIGALLIGLNAGKALALALNKPFIGVNHIEAHLYASIMSHPEEVQFPAIGVVISGGHTSLVLIHEIGRYTLLGQTVDDAIGEAFDKVAKMLSLPYPGGPLIEKLAEKGNPDQYPFKPGKVKERPLDFSFSGLKTSVLYTLKGQNAEQSITLTDSERADLCASFQQAAMQDILQKTMLAAEKNHCQQVIFGGGVTNNRYLRELFRLKASQLQCLWPAKDLSLDNAAMIAGLGYQTYQRQGHGDPLSLQASTRLPWSNIT